MRLSPLTLPPRQRLWLGCGAIALFIMTAVVANLLVDRRRGVSWNMLGHDFLSFYTAGTLVREGRADELYNLASVQSLQRQIASANNLEIGDDFGPFWNPPFYAIVFAPLSALTYSTALMVWTGINLAALGAAVWIIGRWILEREWSLPTAIICTSAPFILALTHGQNTFLSLLILSAAVALWRNQRALAAGLCAGMLFYKPQLAAIVALILVIDLRRRALAGLLITGSVLLLVTLLALPATLEQYLHQLPENIRQFQVVQPYMWERHVTLKAFWRLAIDGSAPGEMSRLAGGLALICMAALLTALIVAAGRGASRDRLIAAALCAMPLLMPFYFDYDLLLLAVPAALLARDAGASRRLIGAWIALALWMFVNPAFAQATRLNVTVLLLGGIAIAMIRRVNFRQGSKETSHETELLAMAGRDSAGGGTGALDLRAQPAG